jgi:CMP-N,N'-diacetyllegionaminic acid synthase
MLLVKNKMINPRVLAIIPARGGSKGLPRKNIIDLAGKPLIAWTIEASLKSKYITKTIVSSDDKEILSISKEYGAEVIKRPDHLASDYATSESVVKHVIDYLESIGEMFDIVVLLQPTSPLRSYKNIDSAFEVMFDSKATAVISVYEVDNKMLKTFSKNNSGFLYGISNNKYSFMRRQDLPKIYMPNGSIYIINTKSFKEVNSFMTNKTLSYIMSKEKSRDIDERIDLDFCTLIINKKTDSK